MSLAIVIPYYKIEFIQECLESLKNQSNQNFNVYIGNDNSPNDPTEIINQYDDFLNIKYVHFKENLGRDFLTKQWDRCVDLIGNEKWIMLIGDDDRISENAVEDFYANLPEIEANQISVVRSNVIEINENNEYLREFFFPKFENPSDNFIKKITQDYHVSLPEFIFSVDAYKQFGFKHFPFAFGSDNLAWLEFPKNKPIYTLPKSICFMRFSSFNISGDKNRIKEKVYAKYLTNKYIIENLANKFTHDQLLIIIKFGYKYLLFGDNKNKIERIKFILLVYKYLNFTELKNLILNRN